MEHGYSDDAFLPVTFATDLMRILRRDDVDVVILNSAPPVLMHRVARDGEILFATSNTVVAEFVIYAVQQFEDTRPLRELQDMQTRQRLGMEPLERHERFGAVFRFSGGTWKRTWQGLHEPRIGIYSVLLGFFGFSGIRQNKWL